MKTKFKILSISLVLFSALRIVNLNKNSLLLWNANKIKIITDQHLNSDKVKIELRINGVSENYEVIFEGEQKIKIVNEYGENDFLVKYDNQFFTTFRHFKTNRRHQHNYNFYFHQKGDKVILKVNIEGIDELNIEKYMEKLKT